MSRLHHLANGQCVLHEPCPVGNNAAGITWKAALIASGMGGRTILTTGTSVWQNTTAEATRLTAGDDLEVVFMMELKPSMSAAERTTAMNAQIASLSAETQARIQRELQFFGLRVV